MLTSKKVLITILSAFIIGSIIYYFYPETSIPTNTTIDKIVVLKSRRQMLVYSQGRLVKTYIVSLGHSPVGQKEYEGDKKTPEGIYIINAKNLHSAFHKNLSISYPSPADLQRARSLGKATGGDIKIHGLGYGFVGKFQRWSDWTAGCIALTNQEVDELYEHTPVGTPINIEP